MPYLGKSPSFGVRQRYQYTATAGQTTFSGTDTENLTLNYTDNNFVDVYQNGVLLKGGGNDYTATSGTSVVLATGASVSDVIEIIVYDAFSAGNFYNRTDSDSRYVNVDGDTMTDGLTISTADNDAQLTLTSTDADSGIGPHQVFYRNSASPADADLLCELDFRGRNDNSENVDYAVINVKANDVSDGTEDGEFILQVATNGSTDTTMHIKPSEIVFNEDSIDRDFRVEGNGKENLLKIDAGNDNVLFGCPSLPSDSVGGAGFENAADSRMILNLSTTTTSSRNQVVFRNPNNAVGTINTSGTTTGYNTSSDYRLKENIVTDWDATSRLKKLKPSQFNFKADKDTTVDGFLAHEVSSVVPIAVTGEKDAVDKDGNPEYQGIDQSKLVPLLVKTVQELEARIAKLEDG